MSTSDIHALSGAYAVDALDDIERAQFSRHLQECKECQAEVASLREAAALLTETSAVAPSADLRSRILGDIKTVRPLPPIAQEQPAATARSGRRDVRWLRGLVAAAAVVAAVAGGAVWQPWSDDTSQNPALSAADRVLQAPDAQRVTQKINGGEATVVASKSLNKIVVITKDLPALEQGKVYEMWLNDAAEGMVPVEGGLMTAADTKVVLEGNVSNALGAGITVEPAGGSRVPTTTPVALFSFENA